MTPFVTPNADFYRVDTALMVPQVTTAGYTLRVKGMVDNEIELTYDDLLDRAMIERDITLTCVSNEVGGHYVGTARWLGARLDDLLARPACSPAPTRSSAARSTASRAGSPSPTRWTAATPSSPSA